VCERGCQIREEAEEGFCELIAYLLMVSQHEEKQKNVILENLYTHGQAALFIEAEKRYGLNDILDWIKYGETGYLEVGRLDKIRNVKIPAKKTVSAEYVAANKSADTNNTVSETNLPLSVLPAIKLQGIIWGTRPTAIINGRSFFANDQLAVKNGFSNVLIRCLEIKKSTVRIRHVDSNQEEELSL